jgi:oligopeptidase B
VEYDIEVAGDRLLILHNADGAENFELAAAPLPGGGDTTTWTPVIAHRADTRLLSVDAFESYLVLYYRRDGLTGLSVLPPSGVGEERPITFPEPIYTVGPGANFEYSATRFRLGYNSMVTPSTVYDYDLAAGTLTVLKQQPVLPSPSGVPFSSGDYEQFREWAVAPDGTRVPISLVCRKGTPRDGSAPCLLYGYGSYEHSTDPGFSITRLSLLDRGSCSRSRTSGAAARWAGRGTTTGRCWRRRTRSATSSRAPSTWSRPAGRRPPDWSRAAGLPAGC